VLEPERSSVRKMPVCFIACLKVKYSFKKYVHDVENMPK
jgi:hypothetical protein